MNPNTVTKVTRQSWFSRLGSSFKGVLTGLILFVIAFPLLFWNEGRAVKTHKSLEEGAKSVISLQNPSVDATNEDMLVHTTTQAATDDILADPEFGIEENAIKLKRDVSMYQWVEKSSSTSKKNLGGSEETTTTYTYKTDWRDTAINSSEFEQPTGHENPGVIPFEEAEVSATTVRAGEFTLSPGLIRQISTYEPLSIPQTVTQSLAPEYVSRAQVLNNTLYIGNPSSPEVGDLKIEFSIVRPQEVSIVAKQSGSELTMYRTSNGGTIEMLRTGATTAEEMFTAAQQGNRVMTWILRVVGFFVMMIGLRTIFAPISVAGDVIPLLGNIARFGLNLTAFFIALSFSAVTIGIAWIFYRPLIGIPLLVFAAATLGFVVWKNNQKGA